MRVAEQFWGKADNRPVCPSCPPAGRWVVPRNGAEMNFIFGLAYFSALFLYTMGSSP